MGIHTTKALEMYTFISSELTKACDEARKQTALK